jgi:uncharacterized protein YneF (UPF0154 family)
MDLPMKIAWVFIILYDLFILWAVVYGFFIAKPPDQE